MLLIGYNFRLDVMNGLGVWDNNDSVGNHVNTLSLANFYWDEGGSDGAVRIDRRLKLTVDRSRGVPPPSDGGGSLFDENTISVTTNNHRNFARLVDDSRGGAALARTSGFAESRYCEAMSDGENPRVSTSKEIHILSLTFDSFFMSNVSGSSDFARLFPFLLV
jgi:hypothetical protein